MYFVNRKSGVNEGVNVVSRYYSPLLNTHTMFP